MNLIFFTSDWFAPDREFRFEYIKRTLTEISTIQAHKKKVIFHCNDVSDQYLQNLLDFLELKNLEIEFVRVSNFAHRAGELCWQHKQYLKWFRDSEYDYMIYWENDMLFTQDHLDYYIENKNLLDRYSMPFFPAFVRFEINNNNQMVSVDSLRSVDCRSRPIIELDGKRFLSHPEFYHGLYIFNKLDAAEHLQSKNLTSDDYIKNIVYELNHPHKHGTCESANSVHLIENVPRGFEHRSVLPLHDFHRSLIHHLPNKFSRMKELPYGLPFGTIPIDSLLI
jgi:hypothetical protein